MYHVAGIQTGHITGYVFSSEGGKTFSLRFGKNQAGLSTFPVDFGSGNRGPMKNQAVCVNFTSVEAALRDLLKLRWQCIRNGFLSLPQPNITKQHLNFVHGTMGSVGNPYYGKP